MLTWIGRIQRRQNSYKERFCPFDLLNSIHEFHYTQNNYTT